MKIKFPILVKYPKQLKSLFSYLDSKGLRWVSGKKLFENEIVPTCEHPYWIFYEEDDDLWVELGGRISYWKVEDESELDIHTVLNWCDCKECEVEFED